MSCPGDWEVKKLGEIFDICAGGDVKRECFSSTHTSRCCYEVFSNGVENRGLYGYTSRALYPAASLTVSARGTIGCAFYRAKDFDAVIRLLVLIPKSNINAKFYEYYINGQVTFEVESTGVAQLTVPKIREKKVLVPPLAEQQTIADTLAAFDTHIANLTELIAKKKAIRDGALEDLMSGRTRLKGFSGDWEVKKLGEVASIQDGTHGTFARVQLGKLLLSAKNVFNNHLVITDNESMVSQSDYNKIIANGYPRKGDILISCVGTIGRCCLLERDDVAFQRSVAFIRPHKFYNKYLMFLLQSRSIQQQLTALINASAQGGVYLNSLKQINLLATTDEDEQQAIAETLSALDDEINALESERSKITQIRDGAMNDLLTGKVRLIHDTNSV